MKSLDSSFQEADFIINNTVKKLKGSNSKTSNNSLRPSNSVLQQQPQQQQKQEKYSQPQQTQLQYHLPSPLSPHPPQHIIATDISSHPFPKSSSLNSSLLHCSINQIPSQPPYGVFDDGHELRPNMPPSLDCGTSSLSTTAFENIIFSNESSLSAASQALPSSCSTSNFNSINVQESPVLHKQEDCTTQHKKANKRPSSAYSRKKRSTNYISKHFQRLLTTSSSPIKRQKTPDNCSSNHASLPATAPRKSMVSFATPDATAISPDSASCNSPSSSSPEVKFFNIHDKIKELYVQLLAHDLHTFGENGIKHRTRSFILERLVEDEKLNTIVINLYPGNKGYALALHYDDKLTSPAVIASPRAGDNFEISNYVITATNAPSSHISTSLSSSSTATNKTASSRNNKPQYSQLQQKSKTSGDDEFNLIEVMHWPYEFDILLQCIDNEVIPDFLMDLLTAPTLTNASVPSQTYRKPNVFYSGCIICEIRDFRQTFGISTNSCDIKHVLLKPTNATIYTDIQNLIVTASLSVISSTASTPSYPVTISHLFRSPEDKLSLESQIVLATAEPLCLDPDPNIGRFAINAQHQRQMFNTHELRRKMKKFSQISINRKRKIDQFMHSYGLELCEYLSRLRHRRGARGGSDSNNTASAADSSNISVKNASSASTTSGNNFFSVLENAASSSIPKSGAIVIKNTSNTLVLPALFTSKLPRRSLIAYHKFDQDNRLPQETTDCQPQLIEERILETKREDNEGGPVIYHIKLSIFQRPSDSEYIGELYVDRDYRKGNRNGESCTFSLGTRNHANRYIQQFTEIFTEEGRKAVKITHCVPGHEPKVTHTGITQEQRHALLPQQQYELLAAQQQQEHQQFQQVGTLTIQTSQPRKLEQQLRQHVVMVAANGQQKQHIIQPQGADNANFANKAHIDIENVNTRTNITTVDITSGNASAGSIIGNTLPTHCIHLHQVGAAGNTTTHQLSPSNGSLAFVQQAPQQEQLIQLQHASITVQDKTIIQQKPVQQLQKIQVICAAHVNTASVTNSALRAQLTSSVPILQTQLKPAPISIHQETTEQQQHILGQQQKTNAETLHINQTINTVATNIMNSTSGRSSSINTKQTTSADLKNSSNASILSFLNSAPAAMTSTRVASGTFTISTGQQESVSLVHPPSLLQQQPQQVVTNDGFTQATTPQPPPPQQQQRKQLLNSQLCKININSSNNANVGCRGAKTATFRRNTSGNIIAANFNPSQDDTQAHQQQIVRVSVSALATQLSSPPAIMTNAANFGYTVSAAGRVGGGSVEILSNGVQQQQHVLANALRHDSPASLLTHVSAGGVRVYGNSSSMGVAAPTLSSESNASSASGFAMPQVIATNSGSTSVNALLATVSPTLYGFDHSQSSTMYQSNHVFLEELNNSSANIVAITSAVANSGNAISIPSILPNQKVQPQQFLIHQITAAKTSHNLQSPAGGVESGPSVSSSISPKSSPHPLTSSFPHQQQTVGCGGVSTTTTANLQVINFSTLQDAVTNLPDMQNVHVEIPGITQPISLQAAVQQQRIHQNSANVSVGQSFAGGDNNGNSQQQKTQRNFLESDPVLSATQREQQQQHHHLQQHLVPAGTATGTQTVMRTNGSLESTINASATGPFIGAGGGSSFNGNASAGRSNTTNTMTTAILSLPFTQCVVSGVKNINPQRIRASGGGVVNSGLTQQQQQLQQQLVTVGMSSDNQEMVDGAVIAQQTENLRAVFSKSIFSAANAVNSTNSPNIQVVSAKQMEGRPLMTTSHSIAGLKIATNPINAKKINAITTSTNNTAIPFVTSTQKSHLKHRILNPAAATAIAQQRQSQMASLQTTPQNQQQP